MTAQTMARPMAVLPLLASSTILSGRQLAAGFGLSDHRQADPSLTEPPGFIVSSLTRSSTPGTGSAVDPHQRRVPDELEDGIDFAWR